MQVTYKVVGTNTAQSHLLNQTLVGELREVSSNILDYYYFQVGDVDYDLEVQKRETLDGKNFLFCWLTDDNNCGRVVFEDLTNV